MNTHATETMLAAITVSLRCMWCRPKYLKK